MEADMFQKMAAMMKNMETNMKTVVESSVRSATEVTTKHLKDMRQELGSRIDAADRGIDRIEKQQDDNDRCIAKLN